MVKAVPEKEGNRRLLLGANPRRAGGGGGFTPPPVFFSRIAKKTAGRRAAVFLHTCLDNYSATFLRILGPGHLTKNFPKKYDKIPVTTCARQATATNSASATDFVHNVQMHTVLATSRLKNQVDFNLGLLRQGQIQGQMTVNALAPKVTVDCDESGIKRFLVKGSSLTTIFKALQLDLQSEIQVFLRGTLLRLN